MPFEQWTAYFPVAAVVVGLALVAWSERERIQSLLTRDRAPLPTETGLTPADRFAKFYALRNWCEQAGAAEAVKAMDSVVLPAIVQGGKPS
jgi:polyferredoxin